MIDWLRRNPREVPSIAVGEAVLPIVLTRLDRARRMTMRLAPDGSEVRISMPTWTRSADALDFARSRADWLAVQLAALPEAMMVADGATLPLRGQELTIHHDPAAPRRVSVRDGTLFVGGPGASLCPRLRRWLQQQSRTLLAEDLDHYCRAAGRAPPPLALSSARRRWGSCAADGTIRINWRLIMAPDTVRRSVVAHEVAHLVHFDHSPAFHTLLGQIFEGSVSDANRWLKAHGRSLYLPFG